MKKRIRLDFLGTGAADWAGPAPDGEYRKVETLGEPLDAQAYFLNEASRQ